MRFLYTAPRYHTNQHYAVAALLDAGHEVTFLVLRRGPSETYESLAPVVLGCSPLFERLRQAVALLPGVALSDVGGIPPIRRFWSAMRRSRPHAVVVRDPRSAYGLLAMFLARVSGANLILYSQTPKYGHQKLFKRRVHGLGRRILRAFLVNPSPWRTNI